MKLLLFILGLTLCTASPTLRGLRNLDAPVLVAGEEASPFDDLPAWVFGNSDDFDNDLGEFALEEETVFNEGENAEEGLGPITEEEEIVPVTPPTETPDPEPEAPQPEPENDLLTQVRGDAVTNDVFNFGVDTVITKGIQDGKIPNTGLTVSSVSAYSKTSDTNGELYKFNCQATNPDATSVLDLNFTVYYDNATQRKTLSSYSYYVKTTTSNNSGSSTPAGNYTGISQEEINTEVVQKVLNYGWSQIYASGTQNGKIPVSTFNIVSIVGVWKQVRTNGASYRCEVVLANQNNATVRANYTVNYNSATQKTSLSTFSYSITKVETTNPGDNNAANGYTELNTTEIEGPEVQAVLAFGTNKILESGYNKSKIPVSDYNITKVVSVAKRNSTNGRTQYKCQVEMEDVKEVLIQAAFAVTVSANQALSIGSWTYNVSNIRTPTNPTNNTNPTTPNNTETNTNTTNPTIPPVTNNTNPSNPTNNTNTTNTNGYTELNATEIENPEVQAVLKAGIDEIIANGTGKGKIPVSDFSISKINSVARRNLTNTRTGYICNVELKDAKKAWLRTQFNVTVNPRTGAVDVGAWTYNIWIPNNYNNTNTNTTTPTTPVDNTNNTTPNNTDSTNTTVPVIPTIPVDNTNNTTPNNTNTTTADGYTQLSAAEIQDVEVQAVLKAGTDEIIASGNKKDRIPISQYNISKINNISRKNLTSTRTGYRCDVELKDAQGAWVRAQFNATVNQRNNEVDVGAWTYNSWIPRDYNYTNNTNTNTTTPTTPVDNTNTTTPNNTDTTNTTVPVIPTIPVDNTNNTNTTTPVTNNTDTNTNTTVPVVPTNNTNTTTGNADGYVQLSAAEAQDAEVQAVLKAGTDEIIASGNQKGRIPVSQYNISKINTVSRKNLTNTRTGYKCDVEVKDAQGAWVRAIFNATVNPKTGAVDVGGWTYNVSVPRNYNYTTNNTTTTPNNTTPVVSTNTTVPVQNTTQPVVDNTPVVNNTTPVLINTTDFTELNQSQIQDTEVQAVVAYGADQVIQRGIARGKIPQSVYNITKVVSVAKKDTATNGKNTYQCSVELTGANNTVVKAQFAATVNTATQEKAIVSWTFTVNK